MVRVSRLQDIMGSWPEWMLTRLRNYMNHVASYTKLWTPTPEKRIDEMTLLRKPWGRR